MESGESLYVVPGAGGWAYVWVPGFAGRLYVRAVLGQVPPPQQPELHIPRAALKVVDLVIDGEGEALGAPFLRELPLGAIETLLNEPVTYRRVLARLHEGPEHLDVATAISHFRVIEPRSGRAPRPTRPTGTVTSRPRIVRPQARPLTDDFLQQIADFYVYVVANGERPLVAIEEEASVPRNTAARWVAMARRRGFLATDPSIKESRKESGDSQRPKRPQETSRQ